MLARLVAICAILGLAFLSYLGFQQLHGLAGDENSAEATSFKFPLNRFTDRVAIIKAGLPPTLSIEDGLEKTPGQVTISIPLGPKVEKPRRSIRYWMWYNSDNIDISMWRLPKWFEFSVASIENAQFEIDGSRILSPHFRDKTEGLYEISLSTLRKIGKAKEVKIVASEPEWNYTLTDKERMAAADLASLIERLRADK